MTFRTAAHEACARAGRGRSHFPLGHIPDADHFRTQKPAHVLLGSAPTAGPAISVGGFEAPIEDQGQTGHCGGTGTSQAVYASAGASGKPLPFVPSPKMIYALARIQARQDSTQKLTDSGVMPANLIGALRWGVMPIAAPTPDGRYDDVWSQDDLDAVMLSGLVNPPNVNDEPSLLDLETSGLKIVTGEYRIDETGSNFAAQIRAGLAGPKCATGIGIFVDVAHFMQWDPSTGPIQTIDLNDPNGGGHWLALTYSYIIPYTGIVVFGGPNSWSTKWPQGRGGAVPGSPFWTPGHYEITASCLQSVCTDAILFPVTVLS
jgi:hypothetical protein